MDHAAMDVEYRSGAREHFHQLPEPRCQSVIVGYHTTLHQNPAILACYRTQIEPTPPGTKPLLSATFISLFKGPDVFNFEG